MVWHSSLQGTSSLLLLVWQRRGRRGRCESSPKWASVSAAQMLVLFDTPAGHALFHLKKPDKLKDADKLVDSFRDVDSAEKL